MPLGAAGREPVSRLFARSLQQHSEGEGEHSFQQARECARPIAMHGLHWGKCKTVQDPA